MSLVFLLGIGGIANATNGDNFIGIGPISRAMGGVGIAAPQDSISAVFANPAGMCFGPYCPGSQLDFAGTIFLPTVHGSIQSPAGPINIEDRSQSNIFLIPAIGLSTPITSDSTSFFSKFRFGLAAYGSSGLGVDYRNRLLGPPFDIFTQYQVFKFAPNIAYRITDNLSVGVNFQLDYTALDLGQGTSSGFGFGGQVGAIYKLGPVSFGLSYVSPQNVEHKRVSSFSSGPFGPKLDLNLEMPQTVGFGIAFQPVGNLLLKDDNLLIEGDFKWINWAGAEGYKDFDWRDQYVFGLGVQYKPIPKLAIRLGVNYGQNPIKTHSGFNAGTTTFVQGIPVNTFQYEYLRIVGFPAIVETHLTCGIGYDFSERFGVNIGYTHGFAKSISETGINFPAPGAPVTLGSKLAEDSIDVGLTWRF